MLINFMGITYEMEVCWKIGRNRSLSRRNHVIFIINYIFNKPNYWIINSSLNHLPHLAHFHGVCRLVAIEAWPLSGISAFPCLFLRYRCLHFHSFLGVKAIPHLISVVLILSSMLLFIVHTSARYERADPVRNILIISSVNYLTMICLSLLWELLIKWGFVEI